MGVVHVSVHMELDLQIPGYVEGRRNSPLLLRRGCSNIPLFAVLPECRYGVCGISQTRVVDAGSCGTLGVSVRMTFRTVVQTRRGILPQINVVFLPKHPNGGTVVKVLCYKSEGRMFDPSWCHWNFSLT